ncbi:MAG: DNA mismatch repair protein MutS [Candidatus Latescibacterota bacterium]|nr:DNA mismatch repair protein MutS [Candidatus Latescibacterota bacterium]
MSSVTTGKLSPAMEQYMRFKREHEDAILFFRMGDFYEMFFDDARQAARLLGLTLTSRNHGKTSGDIPLAGVPHHAAEGYIAKLIGLGHKVAICEQVEDARKAKGIVKRDVVEVVSPGTALSDTMLDGQSNNFVASLFVDKDRAGLAIVDLSTGDFTLDEMADAELPGELERLGPSEVLVAEQVTEDALSSWLAGIPAVATTRLADWQFEHNSARNGLLDQLGVRSLKGFDCEEIPVAVRAAGAAVTYLRDSQRGALDHINRISRRRREDCLLLDANAQRNLDLLVNQHDGSRDGTLLAVIDRTSTSLGARLLRQWIAAPLHHPDAIESRLQAVSSLFEGHRERAQLREQLNRVGDLERMMARVCCRRASPRDLVGLAASLEALPTIAEITGLFDSGLLRKLCTEELPQAEGLVRLVRKAIVDDPPAAIGDGGIIRDSFRAELDELRGVASGGRDWIARLQVEERERTGIASLKIGFNQVFGYYIEVSKANLDRVPDHFTRKQTLVNAERFITPKLKDRETQVLNAQERISELETEIFTDVRDRAAAWAREVQQAAQTVATIDVLAGLAEVAEAERYVRPVVNDGRSIEIEGGRHPVVERQLQEGRFVPNDLLIDCESAQILLITGPNMAGKSTIIRQAGLIVLLAQMGSFVPARAARVGVVDRIFTRVGASDNLVQGESTFMVEMNEASTILNNVTPRSLILLDELGRGTSTFDGLSIAWAMIEYLHSGTEDKPRTLFATHYHELTELEGRLPGVHNYNVLVREEKDQVVFLHRMLPGPCDRSYGIHVARMAGMPSEVVSRANEILERLESLRDKRDGLPVGEADCELPTRRDQMDLFDPRRQTDPELRRLLEEFREVQVNHTTPMQALELLHRWKKAME